MRFHPLTQLLCHLVFCEQDFLAIGKKPSIQLLFNVYSLIGVEQQIYWPKPNSLFGNLVLSLEPIIETDLESYLLISVNGSTFAIQIAGWSSW
jgi:hypothetical protein